MVEYLTQRPTNLWSPAYTEGTQKWYFESIVERRPFAKADCNLESEGHVSI